MLDLRRVTSPVIVESIELLRAGREYVVRVRSTDGAEGISLTNSRAAYLYPILNRLVVPYFIGKGCNLGPFSHSLPIANT